MLSKYTQLTFEQHGRLFTSPPKQHRVKSQRVTVTPPKLSFYMVILTICGNWFQDPHRHQNPSTSTPLYKMASNNSYSQPSTSVDFQRVLKTLFLIHGSLNLWIWNLGIWRADTVYYWKKICVLVDLNRSNLHSSRVNCIHSLEFGDILIQR